MHSRQCLTHSIVLHGNQAPTLQISVNCIMMSLLEHVQCVPVDVPDPPGVRPHDPSAKHLDVSSDLPAMLKTSRASRSFLHHRTAYCCLTELLISSSYLTSAFLLDSAGLKHLPCFGATIHMIAAGASHMQQRHSVVQQNLVWTPIPTCPAGLGMSTFATVPPAQTGLGFSS